MVGTLSGVLGTQDKDLKNLVRPDSADFDGVRKRAAQDGVRRPRG